MHAAKSKLWNHDQHAELDEETAYAVCRLIDCVGFQTKKDWDWEWLNKKQGSYRTLLEKPLVAAAWEILVQKDWLSLQTVADTTKRVATIAPLEGFVNLHSLILQNNSITDLGPLSGLVKLKYLNCFANQIKDLAPIKRLQALKRLVLDQNPLASLSVLEELPSLHELHISTDQVRCLTQCKRLPSLHKLVISGDESVKNLINFPEMPSLKVLRVGRLRDLSGIECFPSLTVLDLSQGSFSRLNGTEKLKGLTHLTVWSSKPFGLEPLSSLYALRSIRVYTPQLRTLSVLARLPVLHEIHLGRDTQCDQAELVTLCESLSPWDDEFRTSTKDNRPSLEIEVVNQEEFDRYDTKKGFNARPSEYEDGMFTSERDWLLSEIRSALEVNFEEKGPDAEFMLPYTNGLRRSERLVIYGLRAYESAREIAIAVQQILCETRNEWIIYFQSLLWEGPDSEELPEDVKDFTAWIYSDKIVATSEDAATLRKLFE